jgi:hypothetical protein
MAPGSFPDWRRVNPLSARTAVLGLFDRSRNLLCGSPSDHENVASPYSLFSGMTRNKRTPDQPTILLKIKFDSDIIIQFAAAGLTIREVPIPTYYGNEICYVDGLQVRLGLREGRFAVPPHGARDFLRPEVRLL